MHAETVRGLPETINAQAESISGLPESVKPLPEIVNALSETYKACPVKVGKLPARKCLKSNANAKFFDGQSRATEFRNESF